MEALSLFPSYEPVAKLRVQKKNSVFLWGLVPNDFSPVVGDLCTLLPPGVYKVQHIAALSSETGWLIQTVYHQMVCSLWLHINNPYTAQECQIRFWVVFLGQPLHRFQSIFLQFLCKIKFRRYLGETVKDKSNTQFSHLSQSSSLGHAAVTKGLPVTKICYTNQPFVLSISHMCHPGVTLANTRESDWYSAIPRYWHPC